MDEMSAFIDEFLTESYENLDQMDQDLVELEEQPSETSILARIFRSIHTLKGTCGFLGFSKLESIAHIGENLLSKLRDKELPVTQETITALLGMGDAIRQILGCLEESQNEGDVDYSQLVDTLTALHNGEPVPDQSNGSVGGKEPVSETATPPAASDPAEPISSENESTTGTLFERLGGAEPVEKVVYRFYQRVLSDPELEPFFRKTDLTRLIAKQKAFMTYAFGGADSYEGPDLGDAHEALVAQGLNDSHFDRVAGHLKEALEELSVPVELIGEVMQTVGGARAAVLRGPRKAETETTQTPECSLEESAGEPPSGAVDVVPEPAEAFAVEPSREESNGSSAAKQEERKPAAGPRAVSESIRVDVQLLDNLMNLVGELVLARNQLVQFSTSETDSSFLATAQHLNQLTSELQESVMKTRMQPIGNIWEKFPRVVRDLAMNCGKKVRLEMEGKGTELDKTLIEAIKDPMTHIVRNSVDHGIESQEERIARGKDPEGCLSLRAYHEGGQVNIEIADDGGGIDPEKVKAKAIEKNVITADQARRMSERELINLIFAPGFSTAAKVSNISGRGVGMDVVKTNIEKIGGMVDIQSVLGKGTTLKVKIPLTLAIVPAMVVMCGGHRYCIPQVSLLELVRLDEEQDQNTVESIQGCPVVRLRGNLLPLVYLHSALGVGTQTTERGVTNIVVLQADTRQFGLVVDRICDTEEIVVKPLGKQLKNLKTYSGATIMGDGKVALILDVMGLAQKAKVVSERAGEGGGGDHSTSASRGDLNERQTLLVFSLGTHQRMAMPLSMVARLEEIRAQDVEHAGDRDVVQYRGEIMPLLYLGDLFGTPRPSAESESLEVVVYADQGRSVGVVVDHIVDIVEENISIKTANQRAGVLGNTVIQGKVTELLDVEQVIQQADPEFFNRALIPAEEALVH